MTNTRKIQVINLWSSDGIKSVDTIALVNFYDYHFDDGGGKVTYKLIGFENEVAVEYFIGDIEIPSAIVSQWSGTDDIIFSYVANSLGLIYQNI